MSTTDLQYLIRLALKRDDRSEVLRLTRILEWSKP